MSATVERTEGRGSTTARKALLLLGVAAFIGLLFYGVASKAPETGIDDALLQGRSATPPGFELPVLQQGSLGPELSPRVGPALADGSVSLGELRGTPVVLNFWASWCTPCREEARLLEARWRASRQEGTLFLGLNQQDLTGDAQAFMREFGTTYPNVRDQDNGVALEWGVTGLPETFFISADGAVVAHVIGVVGEEQLADGIEAARTGRPLGALSGGEQRPAE